MKTDTPNQTTCEKLVSIQTNAVPQVKHCAICKNELRIIESVHHTRFGLDLCEDCLYS